MTFGQYIGKIFSVSASIVVGMSITIRYFIESLLFKRHTVTVQYPREMDVIPERHRGIHYLETEKCIMCWKCSDICPVDCIYIEGVRGADGVLQEGWRGAKATLSKFTVDYTVCIFCGLCEEPCPPKCIHLGPEFDYHSTDRRLMEKNLLTDAVYTEEDEKFVQWARGENERLKQVKAEKKAAAKAAKEKAAAAQEKAAAAPAQEKAAAAPAQEKAAAGEKPEAPAKKKAARKKPAKADAATPGDGEGKAKK